VRAVVDRIASDLDELDRGAMPGKYFSQARP
jgi:hypothetical protein